MSSVQDVRIGNRFGRLTVIGAPPRVRAPSGRLLPRRFLTLCSCGTRQEVLGHLLVSGGTKSCGCLQRDVRSRTDNKPTTHGESRGGRSGQTPTYRAWIEMRDRVRHNPRYAGLRVEARWDDYLAFKEDMGERPAGTSLDRIDGTLGYSKANCRWATRQQQQRNMANNVYIEALGRRMLLIEWA